MTNSRQSSAIAPRLCYRRNPSFIVRSLKSHPTDEKKTPHQQTLRQIPDFKDGKLDKILEMDILKNHHADVSSPWPSPTTATTCMTKKGKKHKKLFPLCR